MQTGSLRITIGGLARPFESPQAEAAPSIAVFEGWKPEKRGYEILPFPGESQAKTGAGLTMKAGVRPRPAPSVIV